MKKSYPRPHVYDGLGAAGQRLARIPRYGRLLALLPAEERSEGTTEAETFWKVYTHVAESPSGVTGVLDDGLRATDASRFGWHEDGSVPPREERSFRQEQVRLARDLLGVLAFSMFCEEDPARQAAPAFVVRHDINGFLNRVFDRFEAVGAYRNSRNRPISGELLWKDWARLKAMDSHGLKHFIFSATEEEIRWTDITTMAFFAAYWACRWATPAELQRTRVWVIDPLNETNEVFREFWTFAAEMPKEAMRRKAKTDTEVPCPLFPFLPPEEAMRREEHTDWAHFVALFTPLYDGTLVDDQQRPIRSTEFLCRSWERMAGTAAQATFLAEFKQILHGDKGEEKKSIAARMLAGLEPLVGSGKPGDTGTFTMGEPPDEDPKWDSSGGRQDNPQHKVTLDPYRLHRFCVTNEEYELFEKRHVGHRWSGEHPLVKKARKEQAESAGTADNRCPVVNVTWYDAWCFAVWCGCRLPTEAQWEYACRAGRGTPFTFNDHHDGKTCTSDVCNLVGKYPFGEGAPKGLDRKCTIPVDALAPNRWEFYQLHGNVWEWCADWYSEDFYKTEKGERKNPVNDEPASARVLRGGSWGSFGRDCRSAFRNRLAPRYRDQFRGFRLAAVRDVGVQQGKEGREERRQRSRPK